LSKIHSSVAIITAYDIKSTGRTGNANLLIGGKISIGAQVTESHTISDHSGFHYRQFLLTSLQKQSSDLKEQFSVCYKNLILKELTMITDLIRSFEAHEALWYHRFVSLP
jgi:hypothetical protein